MEEARCRKAAATRKHGASFCSASLLWRTQICFSTDYSVQTKSIKFLLSLTKPFIRWSGLRKSLPL